MTLLIIVIALGTAVGGWSLIKTLGGKFYKLRPLKLSKKSLFKNNF